MVFYSFEVQLSAVKERLETAKIQNSRAGMMPPSSDMSNGFSFGGAGSRIAKPLRGGGTSAEYINGGAGGPNLPVLSGLQAQEANSGSERTKRGSWVFGRR